jgi:predicted transposase YbfD/YdcC
MIMRWPVPAAASSLIPAVLVKLGPLDTDRIADLRPYFDSVPDSRARRGRWYSLTAILLVCACAVVSGARSIDELAEWGQCASDALLTVIGIRRHLPGWRRAPSLATIGRVLGAVDGDALDRAVGAYLADRHRAATESSPSVSGRPRVIAVDGKALKGSARLTATRRHLLSAVTHGTVVTLVQVEVGAKTNETMHFRYTVSSRPCHGGASPSSTPPPGPGTDAASPARSRPAVSPTNPVELPSPTPAWPSASTAAASRRAHASPVRVSTLSPASTPTRLSPADLAAAIRGHWAVENSSHHIRDVTFAEDASTVHAATAPRAMATLRNRAIGVLKNLGADNIAKITRAIRDNPQRALPILGVANEPETQGT